MNRCQPKIIENNCREIEKKVEQCMQYLSNSTPWEKKVPLAKKDCISSLCAPLNDQYTDGSI